jgi:LPXTG-motif cell wall-anchored protein
VAFAYRGIPYTSREKVIDSDPVKATASQKVFPISPLLIGLALVSGAVLIVVRSKKS